MRRIASCVVAPLVLGVSVLGCSQKKDSLDTAGVDTAEPADLYSLPAEDAAMPRDSFPAYGSAVADSGYRAAASFESNDSGGGPRYHTVVRHDTLYGLSRQYYGDHRRWKDIYEANRDTIRDPNKIRVGQRLLIP